MEESKDGPIQVNLKSNSMNNQPNMNFHEQGSSQGMNNQEGQEVTNEEKDEVCALYRDGYEANSAGSKQQQEYVDAVMASKPVVNVEMCVNCEDGHR